MKNGVKKKKLNGKKKGKNTEEVRTPLSFTRYPLMTTKSLPTVCTVPRIFCPLAVTTCIFFPCILVKIVRISDVLVTLGILFN
jgi:hypothetical protein